jgi:putative NAD(P)-binding protein
VTDRRVRIAGAGPAGLCAAVLLARSGVSVEVREKRAAVGMRFRGAVHGLENWSTPEPFGERLGAWGLELDPALSPCHELTLCDEDTARTIRSVLPLFYLVGRGPEPSALEGTLLELARDSGATVTLGAVFSPEETDMDATGPSSARRVCVEAGIHFRTRSPDRAVALVSRRATPCGYAYLLVRAGRGSLSAVRFDGRPVSRDQLASCERLLRRHVAIDIDEAHPGAGFGSLSLLGQLSSARGWALGEAAGLQDFLWGFGIRRALESAALAARSWREGGDYPQLARAAFRMPDRAALVNRYVWDKTAALGLHVYADRLCRRGDVRASLRRATSETALHRALYPLLSRRLFARFPHLAPEAA